MKKAELVQECTAKGLRTVGLTVPELRAVLKPTRSGEKKVEMETDVPSSMTGWASKNKATIVRKLLALGEEASLEDSKGDLLLKLRTLVERANPPPAEELTKVGFGQHANMSYKDMWEADRGYCDWAVLTFRQEKTTKSKALVRFATWILKKEAEVASAGRSSSSGTSAMPATGTARDSTATMPLIPTATQ